MTMPAHRTTERHLTCCHEGQRTHPARGPEGQGALLGNRINLSEAEGSRGNPHR